MAENHEFNLLNTSDCQSESQGDLFFQFGRGNREREVAQEFVALLSQVPKSALGNRESNNPTDKHGHLQLSAEAKSRMQEAVLKAST